MSWFQRKSSQEKMKAKGGLWYLQKSGRYYLHITIKEDEIGFEWYDPESITWQPYTFHPIPITVTKKLMNMSKAELRKLEGRMGIVEISGNGRIVIKDI